MNVLVISRSKLDWVLLNTFATFVLFLFIYSPVFLFFPVNVNYFVILFAIAYISYRNNLYRLVTLLKNKVYFTYLFLYFFCIFYILLVPTFSEWPFDKSFLIVYVRLLLDIVLVLPFFVLVFCFDLNYTIDDFLKLIVKIGVIQAVIATAMFIIPGLKEFVFGYIIELPSEKLLSQPYRGYGISNDFYFASPLFQGLVFIINSILYIKTSKKKYLVFYIFILISMVTNARITVAVIPIFFFVIFLLSFYYDDLKWMRKLSGILLVFLGIIVLVVFYFVFNPEKVQALIWLADGVIGSLGAISGNFTESKTLTIMVLEHIHLPQRLFHVWFGEGLVVFANPNAPIRSDLGYIRYIYYGGIVLSILKYFSIINLSVHRIINSKDPLIKSMLLALLITTFIVHFKGDIFNSSAFLKGFFLLILVTLYNPKTQIFDAK